ncbi:MAG: hypothetical protein KF856_08835 [Cyclobacteriaceae bacterium]|nr:hypothetical protein [Cyclobacteriaceae bacterium]
MPTPKFDELKVNTRIKLVALWVATMFFYIYGDYFALYIPGEAGKLVDGKTLLNEPIKVFAASVLMSLPSLVIITTTLALAAVARWVNIVFGIIFTTIMVLIAVTSFPITAEVSAYVFYAVVESCITVVIIWQAWKWPKSID